MAEVIKGTEPNAVQQPDWTSNVDDSHKALLEVKGWKSPNDVIKGYSELEKLVGYEKIPMPRKDATGNYDQEDFSRVMKQLGLPSNPSEYKTSEAFKLPEGVSIDGKYLDSFKERMHKAGLLPKQFEAIMDEYGQLVTQGHEHQQKMKEQEFNEASNELRNKWGLAYEQNTKIANTLLKEYGGDKAQEVIKKYGNDPVIIELLANVGKELSEETLSKHSMTSTMLSPEAAKMEIQKIRVEQSAPLMDGSHPEHNYWLKKLDDLYKMAG